MSELQEFLVIGESIGSIIELLLELSSGWIFGRFLPFFVQLGGHFRYLG